MNAIPAARSSWSRQSPCRGAGLPAVGRHRQRPRFHRRATRARGRRRWRSAPSGLRPWATTDEIRRLAGPGDTRRRREGPSRGPGLQRFARPLARRRQGASEPQPARREVGRRHGGARARLRGHGARKGGGCSAATGITRPGRATPADTRVDGRRRARPPGVPAASRRSHGRCELAGARPGARDARHAGARRVAPS